MPKRRGRRGPRAPPPPRQPPPPNTRPQPQQQRSFPSARTPANPRRGDDDNWLRNRDPTFVEEEAAREAAAGPWSYYQEPPAAPPAPAPAPGAVVGEISRRRRRRQRAVASEFSFMGPFAGVESVAEDWGLGGEGEGWDLDRGRYEYFPNLSTLREDEDGGFGAVEEEIARGPYAPNLPPPNNNPSTATATAGPRYGNASFHAQDEENWAYLFPGVPVHVPSPTQIPHNPLTVNNTTFFHPPFIPPTRTRTRRTPFTSNATTRPTTPRVNPPQPPPQAPKKPVRKPGRTRTDEEGNLWVKINRKWVRAAYHNDRRARLLELEDARGTYAYPPPSGVDPTDRTSFHPAHATMNLDGPRANRPAILYQWNPPPPDPTTQPPPNQPRYLLNPDNPRIHLLSQTGHPIPSSPHIPLTLSGQIPGVQIELYRRLSPSTQLADIIARTPNTTHLHAQPRSRTLDYAAFANRAFYDRLRMETRAWSRREGSDSIARTLRGVMPERVARELDVGRGGSGSTVGWRDLTDEEIKAIQRVSQGAARRRVGWRGLDVRGRKEGSVAAAEKRRQAERVVRRMREEKRVRDERDGFVGGEEEGDEEEEEEEEVDDDEDGGVELEEGDYDDDDE